MKRARALAVSLALLSACTWLESTEDEDQGDPASRRNATQYTLDVDDKLRAYSSCREAVASLMTESWNRYDDQVDARGRPRRSREGVYLRGIGSNSFRGCRRVLAAAPRTPPDMPVIHDNATKLVEAAERFAEHTRTLERYFDNEAYFMDEWGKLHALDPELRQFHEDWQTADEAMEQAIDVRHIENDALLLGVLEGSRPPLEVDTRRLMIRARPLVRCITREPAPSAADCQAEFDALADAHARFAATYTADRESADKVFWMSTFAIDVDEFFALARREQDRLAQKRVKTRDLQPLVDAYSSLVRDADTLDFDFP